MGYAVRGRIKGKGGGGRREHAHLPEEQALTRQGVRPRQCGTESGVARQPNDGAQSYSGPISSHPGPVRSHTCLCARPFTHPREQPRPRQPSSSVLGSARLGHRDYSAPWADSLGAQPQPDYKPRSALGRCPWLRVAIRAVSASGSQSRLSALAL